MTTGSGDPTPRTIEQLKMYTDSLRELFEAKFDNIETRFSETDKALKLQQENMDRQPTPDVLDERLIALKESVDIRFQGLKELANTLAVSNEKKLELALSSQQEAAKKSETAFNKQLDAVAERVNDIKDRTINMEAGEKGSKQNSSSMIAIAAVVISFVGVLAVIIINIIGKAG